jgi:leucyl-tRNA synthetase
MRGLDMFGKPSRSDLLFENHELTCKNRLLQRQLEFVREGSGGLPIPSEHAYQREIQLLRREVDALVRENKDLRERNTKQSAQILEFTLKMKDYEEYQEFKKTIIEAVKERR